MLSVNPKQALTFAALLLALTGCDNGATAAIGNSPADSGDQVAPIEDVTDVDAATPTPAEETLRIATYNLADARTGDLKSGDNARLKTLAGTIQRVRPDILFVNEIVYEQEGSPEYTGGEEGQNAQRFADNYLAVSQGEGLLPLSYRAVMRPSNTGMPSGVDLDMNGSVVSTEGNGYGGDCWGYGDFKGQYALAVLVRSDLEIDLEGVRTFQKFKWSDMPGAIRPVNPNTGVPFHSDEVWAEARLSSKTHMDVPVTLPNGTVLHVLASHPTPPVFDGPEDRNGARNHDEIRFWAEYMNGAEFLVDDDGVAGGLEPGASFVVAGDMNADTDEGDSYNNPMMQFLLGNPMVNASFVPEVSAESDTSFGRARDADDTSTFGYRLDYVLPSSDMTVVNGAVERVKSASDHAMVWIDVVLD